MILPQGASLGFALSLLLSGNGGNVGVVSAFAPLRPSAARAPTALSVGAAVEPPKVNGEVTANGDGVPMGWECDDEANCAEVPACDEVVCRTSLDVRIHGEWYDLSGTSLDLDYHGLDSEGRETKPFLAPSLFVACASVTEIVSSLLDWESCVTWEMESCRTVNWMGH